MERSIENKREKEKYKKRGVKTKALSLMGADSVFVFVCLAGIRAEGATPGPRTVD